MLIVFSPLIAFLLKIKDGPSILKALSIYFVGYQKLHFMKVIYNYINSIFVEEIFGKILCIWYL